MKLPKSTHFEIVGLLAHRGVNRAHDLSAYFRLWLRSPDNMFDVVHLNKQENVNHLMRILEELGHIQDYRNNFEFPNEGYTDDEYVKKLNVSASLTHAGFEYYNQQLLIRSNLLVNEGSQKNFIAQKRMGLATLLVAFLTISVSAISIYSTESKMDELEKNMYKQQKLIDRLIADRTPKQNPVTYPVGKSRIYQPSGVDSLQTTYSEKLKSPK
ncbi:hypothetical protein SAMN05421813_10916 [Daejeonella rubra]|uniref:Uncharacterized protein n=1 Tax=Daejeonella rubra TaxID=990371 RepID=A0A1G9S0R3_9SPHI|nr:hypothetical protein [Daejeonella rubra]SDM28867.1 hypothetical protein SAMN05421813_10916 [Daejeonella rubra]